MINQSRISHFGYFYGLNKSKFTGLRVNSIDANKALSLEDDDLLIGTTLDSTSPDDTISSHVDSV